MGGRSSVGEIPLILLLLQLVIPESLPAPLTPGPALPHSPPPPVAAGRPGTPRGPGPAGRSERGRGRPSPARAPAGGRGARSGTLSVWSSPVVHAVPNTSRHPLFGLFILLSGAVRISFFPLTTFAMVGSSKVALVGEGLIPRLGTRGRMSPFNFVWFAPPQKATRRLWGADVQRVISK